MLEDLNCLGPNLEIRISITAQQDARSGEIKLVMDSNQYSWFHSEDIEVVVLPNPVLTFASVEIGGDTWSNILVQANTQQAFQSLHMVGREYRKCTMESFDHSTIGQQSARRLYLSWNNFKGRHQANNMYNHYSAMADPASEPEFRVTLSGDLVSINETVTMLVALSKEVLEGRWAIES